MTLFLFVTSTLFLDNKITNQQNEPQEFILGFDSNDLKGRSTLDGIDVGFLSGNNHKIIEGHISHSLAKNTDIITNI